MALALSLAEIFADRCGFMPPQPSAQEEEQKTPNGFPLLAFSIGTFGTGLFIASRQYKKEKLSKSLVIHPVLTCVSR